MSAEKPYLGVGSPEEFSATLGVGNWSMDEITYVEHFYMAAFTTCFFSEHLTNTGSALWDVIGGPLAALVFRDGWENKWKKVKHDLTQAVTCNLEGTNFGKQFWQLLQNEWSVKIVEEIMAKDEDPTRPSPPSGGSKPPPIPPAPPAGNGMLGRHTVAPGEWLSMIAGRWYKGEVLFWPVIYDANRQVIGPNPNKLRRGQVLKIPSIQGYSPMQLDQIRRRGRDWRKYNK
jgi:hypothetical protein